VGGDGVVEVDGKNGMRLTNDFTVGDIWLDKANAVLDLGGNTLTVNTREHPLTPGTVLNYGAIGRRQATPLQFVRL